MAHWGIALASGPHINFPLVPPDAAALAWKELELARKHAALAALRDLLSQERLQIIIDRTYPMSEIVEAHRYVDGGHKAGNVVITIADD